jgi:hypothetical protein
VERKSDGGSDNVHINQQRAIVSVHHQDAKNFIPKEHSRTLGNKKISLMKHSDKYVTCNGDVQVYVYNPIQVFDTKSSEVMFV